MKKIFAVVVAGQRVSMPQAFTENRGGQTTDTYVLTDSVQGTNYGLKVQLHTVGRYDSYSKYWEVGFVQRGNTVIKPDYVKILQILRDNG